MIGTNIAPWVFGSFEISFYERGSISNIPWIKQPAYSLFPCPITGHEIRPNPFMVLIEDLFWCIVNFTFEVGVRELIASKRPWVAESYIILR